MNKKIFFINFLVLIIFLLDRFFKFIFLQTPNLHWSFVFGWHLSKNFGIAFNLNFSLPIAIIVSSAVIFILISFLIQAYKKNNFFEITFLTLITFGAFSNLLDRVRFGFVIDYVEVPYFTVLILADVMVTVGMGMILIKELFYKNSK